MQPLNSLIQSNTYKEINEETKNKIVWYFRLLDKPELKVSKAIPGVIEAVVKIYKRAEEDQTNVIFSELEKVPEVPLETLMDWVSEEFKAQGYLMKFKIKYEMVGESFIDDKPNTMHQDVARIALEAIKK